MARFSVLQAVASLAWLSSRGAAQGNATNITASAACNQLLQTLGNATILPANPDYEWMAEMNWSQTAWGKPTCIIHPNTTSQLESSVKILVNGNVHFAVRSGGHSTGPFSANINEGVLIDMSNFIGVQVDTGKNTATVGTGLRWAEAYNELDKHNVTIVGGRVLGAGVGGLTLGSGLSYLSDLYGLACDNVVSFEVVLANGTAVNATAESHKDLFWALKGTSNNFGIVTSFTFSTIPSLKVWGGLKLYTLDKLPALFDAMAKYQTVGNKDPYANIMLQAFPTNASIGAILNMIYLKPEEKPKAFEPFYSINVTADTTKLQTLTELLSGAPVPDIPRVDWFTTSFKPDPALYKQVMEIITNSSDVKDLQKLVGGSMAFGIQPISESAIRAGNARGGGNALGLQAVNQTWLVLDTGWVFPEDDVKAHNYTRGIINKVDEAAKASNNYIPYIFMNDASYDQNVIASYGAENNKKLKDVQKVYDPNSVFQKLVPGGHKLPK